MCVANNPSHPSGFRCIKPSAWLAALFAPSILQGTMNWTTAQAAPISCQVVPVQAKQNSQQHCRRWGIAQTLSCWSCPAALRHSSSGQPPWGGLPLLWACNTVPLATCPMSALGSAQLRSRLYVCKGMQEQTATPQDKQLGSCFQTVEPSSGTRSLAAQHIGSSTAATGLPWHHDTVSTATTHSAALQAHCAA